MDSIVELSRLQFAMTAMYHFMFVPLTLGMSWLLVIMESCYVRTGNQVYKDMTRFWGKLFGINFAVGVTTGLTMEFQFGTNWAYYSHYVGDIFGTPLAIEGLMAFFLESTFIGMFFFSWDRVSKKQHLLFTVLVAIGSNLSAFWILVANGWMQNPVGSHFNPVTMRMELTSLWDLIINPIAIDKYFHTITAGYVTGSIFVMGISSYYLIRKTDTVFAKLSFKIAATFGLISTILLIFMGDRSGLDIYKYQPSKVATIEGMWDLQKAPVPWAIVAWPDMKSQSNLFEVQIPYAGSLILTHGISEDIPGIKQVIAENKAKIIRGKEQLALLEQFEQDRNNQQLLNQVSANNDVLGYGLLLKKYVSNMSQVTDEIIDKAALDTIPNPLPLFYAFRIMVALGGSFLLLFLFACFNIYKHDDTIEKKSFLLKWSLFWIPMPWISAWSGWFVAEYGRQPWTVFGVLPTYQSVSNLSMISLQFSFVGFLLIYTILAIIELFLMIKYVKLGPSSLGTGQYHFEKGGK